ncbi:patatin-like phospholipase family protein [Marinobacteraceae bacterium S3BR75-40.1]
MPISNARGGCSLAVRNLSVRAGAAARRHLEEHGLSPADVGILPGAAGGPKALGIQGLDLAVFGEFLPRAPRVRSLVGASIGSWRFAAVAQSDPVAGLRRLGELYLAQRFEKGVTPTTVSERSVRMLEALIDGQAEAILANPDYRLNVVINRSRGLLASDERWKLLMGLSAAIGRNLISRKWLGGAFERVIAHDPRQPPPFGAFSDMPAEYVTLTPGNLETVLLASGSIPMVMDAVRDVPGLPPGAYRDGGMTDYHLDLPFEGDGIILYPHFTDRVIPGWFDKPLKWRQGDPNRLSNMLLVAPSGEYLANLPHGKLPDRKDFETFAGDDANRERYWRQAIDESRRLGDDFLELVESGRWMEVVEPL